MQGFLGENCLSVKTGYSGNGVGLFLLSLRAQEPRCGAQAGEMGVG